MARFRNVCTLPMHDNDGKQSRPFLDTVADSRIKTRRTAMRPPNTVAFVERIVQTTKQECLDHFSVFGEEHMTLLCSELLEQYHTDRPQHGMDNDRVHKPRSKMQEKPDASADSICMSDVRCKERLGGLPKSCSRKAA